MATGLDPKIQSLLTGAAAIGLGVVAPCYLGTNWLATAAIGVAGAIGGVGSNLVSQFLAKVFDRRETDPRRPDLNHDLLKLLGKAITREIATVEREEGHTLTAAERRCLVVFLGKAGDAFERLVHNNTLPHIAPPDVQQLLTEAARPRSQSMPSVGTVAEWQQIVYQLNRDCQAGLEDTTETLLAQRLHTRLWQALHSELKQDFAGEGRAYAALHLGFMGDVLATLNTLVRLPREQSQLTQELLEELRAHKARQADPKEREIVAALTADDQERVAPLLARLKDLGINFEAGIGRVLAELVKNEQAARHRHRVVLVVLLVLVVGGGGATWLLRSGQNAQQATVQRIEGKVGDLADALLARVSAKDQEIGALKAQLAAALQRAEQAGVAGDTTASDALAQIRKDGDPKKLGAFLDRQLAKQQTEVVDLLRERAAVAYISGEIARAEQCLQQILVLLPNDLDAINRLGWIYQLRGDLDGAERQYRRVLDLAPDDQAAKAAILGNLGLIARTRGQLDEAERLHRESLAIEQQLGRLEGQAATLGNLGVIARTRGQLDAAERLHREALAIDQQLGRLEGQAIQLGNLGAIAEQRGNIAEARRLWTEARDLYAQIGAKPMQERVQGWLDGLPPK